MGAVTVSSVRLSTSSLNDSITEREFSSIIRQRRLTIFNDFPLEKVGVERGILGVSVLS